MADVGTEFLVFLKANDPDDFAKVSGERVSDAMLNTIFQEHRDKFELWRKVPEWLRTQCNNRVPDEILEKARRGEVITPSTLNQDDNLSIKASQPGDYGISGADVAGIEFTFEDIMALAVIARAVASKGYSPEAAQKIAANKQTRHLLLQKLAERQNQQKEGKRQALTPAEKKLWEETRHNDRKTIKKDWIDNQPERYVAHLLKKLNAGKIDRETALPELDLLMKKIKEEDRIEQFYAIMQTPQAGIQRYTPETKELLEALLVSNGIENKNQKLLDKVYRKVQDKTAKSAGGNRSTPSAPRQPNDTNLLLTTIKQQGNRNG